MTGHESVPPGDSDRRTRENARAAGAFLDAIKARDVPALEGMLGDDVVYHFPGESSLAGTYRGKAEVLAFLPRLPSLLDEPPLFDVHDVLASETHATDLSTYYGIRRRQRFSWRVSRVYHFDRGRISEIFVMVDDQTGLDWFLGDAFVDPG
jgi:ketosteroid isomerase-like protein